MCKNMKNRTHQTFGVILLFLAASNAYALGGELEFYSSVIVFLFLIALLLNIIGMPSNFSRFKLKWALIYVAGFVIPSVFISMLNFRLNIVPAILVTSAPPLIIWFIYARKRNKNT